MQKAKRGFARKELQEDGLWLLTIGKSGEEDITKMFEGTAEEADDELLEMYKASFKPE